MGDSAEADAVHSLVWQYVKDGGNSDGGGCAWVDYLQCCGDAEPSPPEGETFSYVYDPSDPPRGAARER
jgi:hypothetical protein